LFWSFVSGINKIIESYKKFRIKEAIAETMNLARAANKYFNDEEPWKTIKTDNIDACNKTIYLCCQAVYTLSILFAPIIPYTSYKIQDFFGANTIRGSANNGLKTINYIKDLSNFKLASGTEIIKPIILFSQIEDKIIEEQISKLG